MRKPFRIGAVLVIAMSGLLIAGCGMGNNEERSGMGEPEEPIEREYTELSFRTITVEDAPEEVRTWIEKNNTIEQNKVFNVDGKSYVIVALGEKPTGGYDVRITQIADIEHSIFVSYEVIEPEESDFVTQVITYPVAIAEMDEQDKPFQFSTFRDTTPPSTEQSDSKDGSSVTVSGEGYTEITFPQKLTSDGEVDEEGSSSNEENSQ